MTVQRCDCGHLESEHIGDEYDYACHGSGPQGCAVECDRFVKQKALGAELRFEDGRVLPAKPSGAAWYIYRDKDGVERTFACTDVDVYVEHSSKQLKWWQCDCGRGWWGGESDPEAEAHGCFSCRTVVKVLDQMLGRT